MKLKNVKFYSIYFLVILSFIIIMGVLLHRVSMETMKSFNIQFLMALTFLVSVVFGFILGFDQLYNHWQKLGKWHIDILRLLSLGLPSLILVVWNTGPIMLSRFIPNISLSLPPYPLDILLYSKFSLYAMTFIIGYVIATSFYKEDNIGKKSNEKLP